MDTSPRLSFEGYDIKYALYRNKDALKGILAVLTMYSTYLVGTQFDWQAFLVAIGLATGVLASKLVYDAFDYFFTEVEL